MTDTLKEEGGMEHPAGPLTADEAEALLAGLDGWSRQGDIIVKTYRFPDYHRTMAFVNAVAWIAHRSDHHPDMAVGYDHCRVAYTTHSVGGLSRKDFISAAAVDRLFSE